MSNHLIKTGPPKQKRTRRSTTSKQYEKDLFNSFVDLFDMALKPRNFTLKHKTNRNASRLTNQNRHVSNKSCVSVMNSFLNNQLTDFTYPYELLFMRSFKKANQSKNNIGPTSFDKAFKELKSSSFQKKYPSITFTNISQALNKQGYSVNAATVEKGYDTIVEFLKSYRRSK